MKKILCFFLVITNYALTLSSQINRSNTDSLKTIFGKTEEDIFNFTGYIYFLPENTEQIPDFNKLKDIGKIFTQTLNITPQYFKNGFPGINDRFEYFAIDYFGQFFLKDSGTYCFVIGSDDGSKLFIDNQLIINNDKLHMITYKFGCIRLERGFHKIEVQYFQGPKYEVALVLKYKKSDYKTYQVFDLSQFYPIEIIYKESLININLHDDVLFEFNSFKLNDNAKKTITDIKRILLDRIKFKTITIEGYTDDIGRKEFNQILSEKRAKAVKEFLISSGIDSKLIDSKGLGDSHPRFINNCDENRMKNRRVELRILKM